MTQNLKIRACFMQNFMKLEKIDLKVVIFGGGGLGPKN